MSFERYDGFEDMLFDYASGRLPEEEKDALEAELRDSDYLRRELERYEGLLVVLTAAAEEELRAPDGLAGKVGRRVAVKAYLAVATGLAEGLLGDYGRAIIYYLRLS